jgi:Ser/Thr protein kinase RdoA (MazF antagonist)
VKGRFIPNGIRPDHYKAQGRLMAQMHAHAAHWGHPKGPTKRRYDWDGLFRDDSGTGIRASEAWALLPRAHLEPFEFVTQQTHKVMDEWGKCPEVYGLIHADLGVDANVLFWSGEARAIDFDDSGFGYWIYDLAVSLEHCQEDDDFSRCKDALFDGYSQVRSLPQEQLEHFDLFQAGFHVYEGLWCVAAAQAYPKHKEELFERLDRAARLVVRYLESC